MRFSDNFTEQCSTNINSWATSFDQFFNLLELSWRMFSWYLFFKVRLGGTGRTFDQQADKLHFYMRMSQISQWLRIIKLNCEYTHSFSNMLVLLLNVRRFLNTWNMFRSCCIVIIHFACNIICNLDGWKILTAFFRHHKSSLLQMIVDFISLRLEGQFPVSSL